MDSQCTSVHQKDKSIGSMLMFTELNEVWHQSNNIIINKLNFINMIIALAYIIFFVTVIIIIIIITTTIIIIIIIIITIIIVVNIIVVYQVSVKLI